jgi:hypothetical protein
MEYAPNLVVHFVHGSLDARSQPKTEIAVRDGVLILTDLSTKELVVAYAKTSATVFYAGIIIGKLYGVIWRNTSPSQIEGAGREMRNSSAFNVQDPVLSDSLIFYKGLKGAVEAAGADLLVVSFPFAYVVNPEDRARWAILGVKNIEGQIQYEQAFTSHLNEIGIRTLNLSEPFLRTARTEKMRVYF